MPVPVEGGDVTAARAMLENALVGLRAIADPFVAIFDAEREISTALYHAYGAAACGGDADVFRAEVENAILHCRAALAVLQAWPTDDRGTDLDLTLVARALGTLTTLHYVPLDGVDLPRPGAVRRPLRASVGEPRILDLERWVLEPTIPLPDLGEPPEPAPPLAEMPPPVGTLEELGALMAATEKELSGLEVEESEEEPAAPPRSDSLDPLQDEEWERELFGAAMSREDVVLDRARVLVEEIGALGRMRMPEDALRWLHGLETERRLLCRLDALVACGTWVFPHAVKMLEDRPVPDPELTWALLFFFGSLAGDDALDQAMRIARITTLDEEMLPAVVDALGLAPHPGIEREMNAWLRESDPARRVVAVDVLSRRRTLSFGDVAVAAQDPDLGVRRAAAAALAFVAEEVEPAVVWRLVRSDDPATAGAAMISATLQRISAGARHAEQLTSGGKGAFGSAALVLALTGSSTAVESLKEDAAAGGSPALVEALGWYGHLDFVDYLVGRLSSDDGALVPIVAEALHRITGAGLTAAMPDPQYREDELPFGPERRDPEPHADLSLDPVAWDAWWRRHRHRADPAIRYRFGHVWSPADNLWELRAEESTIGDRRHAWTELVARTGATASLDLHHFVSRQRAQLASIHVSSDARGSWPTRFAR